MISATWPVAGLAGVFRWSVVPGGPAVASGGRGSTGLGCSLPGSRDGSGWSAGGEGLKSGSYHGWYRHITLAMLAAAFLAVQDARAARERDPAATPPAQRGEAGSHSNSIVPIRFTAYEIRRLLVLTQPQLAQTERVRRGLTWSRWRRCHQAVARDCHRRRNRARASIRASAPPPRPYRRTTTESQIYN